MINNFYGEPPIDEPQKYQQYFYRLIITFQIEGEKTTRKLLQNLEFIPKKPELEKFIKDKIERYTHSRRFCRLNSSPIAKLIKYSIRPLINID